MLENEKKLLFTEFDKCFNKVKNDKFFKSFAEEKITHSLQVYGAGNLIIKNEAYFKNKSEDFIKKAKIAVLFHDIGRFDEILAMYNKEAKVDHGLRGSEILKKIPEYNDIRITLAVKHHGHMPEQFYEDEEFLSIDDEQLKSEAEQIFWLARDADKIANLLLIVREYRFLFDIFFENLTQEQKNAPVSEIVKNKFDKNCILLHSEIYSLLDRILQIICFKFELYYQTSHDFLRQHDINKKLWQIFDEFCVDKNICHSLKKSYFDFGDTLFRIS